MKKNITYLLVSLAIFFSQVNLKTYSQEAFWFGADATVNVTDSVLLRLKDYVGESIQWEKSYDNASWTRIPGEIYDTLLFVADTTTYLRAKVYAGDCDPFISDTTMISVHRLSPDVFKVDDYALNLISDSTELANGIYIYEGNVSNYINEGNVLLSNEGFGYMRRVMNIEVTNNQTVIETEQAALTEAVEHMNILDSLIITMPGEDKAYINGKPIPIQEFYMIPGAKFDYEKGGINLNGINFSVDVSNQHGESGTVTAHITNGHVLFNPIFAREVDIGWFVLNRFSLTAGGSLDFDLEAYFETDIQVDYVNNSERILYALIGPIPLGPVPMFIECSIEVEFSAEFEITGTISFGFESDFYTVFGAEYVRDNNPRWGSIWNSGGSFDHKPLELDIYGGAIAKFGVGPRFDVTIAGAIGPYLSVNPYLEGVLDVPMPNWMFDLNAGIEGNLGFEVGILGFTLANYYTTLPVIDWLVWTTGGSFAHLIPVADFSGTPTSGTEPLTVYFTDESLNEPTGWQWDFGDGSTSSQQHPQHTYQSPGTYNVELTVSNYFGSDTEIKENYIQVDVEEIPPIADFIGTPTSGTTPLTVSFTDESTGDPTSWQWDFGDGNTSSQQHPQHIYQEEGIYTVQLTVINEFDSDIEIKENYIQVDAEEILPIADFSGTPTSGTVPLTVSFTDESTGEPTNWQWDFGDGSTSSQQHPQHTYLSPGTYTVELTVSNDFGSDMEIKHNFIQVNATGSAPIADFSGTPTSGTEPLTVYFTDESHNEPTSWQWDFGDGSTSSQQHPQHTYLSPGTYTVELTVSNDFGSDTEIKHNYVQVNPGGNAPIAWFNASLTSGTAPLTVNFTDESLNEPTSWQWDFGDGGTSSQQHPQHTYLSPGVYSVGLTVENNYGWDTYVKTNYITVDDNGDPGIIYGDGVIDIDGNEYVTVIIGDQEWMAENLRVTRDASGNNITRYCYDDNSTNCNLYGGLYTWHTIMNGAGSSNNNPSGVQGICPTGWHVPSNAEWTELVNYVESQGYPNVAQDPNGAGNALKSCRQVGSPLGGDCDTNNHPRWDSNEIHHGFDVFGFSALPGGNRGSDLGFFLLGHQARWWASTLYASTFAWQRNMSLTAGNFNQDIGDKTSGFSLRCVRD